MPGITNKNFWGNNMVVLDYYDDETVKNNGYFFSNEKRNAQKSG